MTQLVLPTMVESEKTKKPSERFTATAKSVPRASRLIPNTMGGIQKNHKRRKYNINTYRVFLDDDDMSDLQVATFAEENKKKIRNQGHRMLTRVKKFMTCGEFFPKKWTQHMVLSSICVFNRYFSIKNIMATHEFSAQTKEYLMNKIKEHAPKSFYEFWTSNASNSVTTDSTQTVYVDKVCRYMQNTPDDFPQLIEFFKKMKAVINYYHGPLQFTYLSLLNGNKKVPEEYFAKEFREHLLTYSLSQAVNTTNYNKEGFVTVQKNVTPDMSYLYQYPQTNQQFMMV